MDKGKAVMGSGRRWAVDFTDNSTAPSSRDFPDPPGFSRASQDQVLNLFFLHFGKYSFIYCFNSQMFLVVDVLQDDSTVTKQKKDAEANWKAQVSSPLV